MKLPQLQSVCINELEWVSPFDFDFDESRAFAFLKGNSCGEESCSILALHPFLILEASSDGVNLTSSFGSELVREDPLILLQSCLESYSQITKQLRFNGGAIAAFSYDFGLHVQGLQTMNSEKSSLMQAAFFKDYYVFDEAEQKMWHVSCKTDSEILDHCFHSEDIGSTLFSSNMSSDAFKQKVKNVIKLISEGEMYQVNISQKFSTKSSQDLFPLFKRLHQLNPSGFTAFLQFTNVCLLSSSPERFLKRDGKTLLTMPIKGTRPRGKTAIQDEALRQDLLSSEKESAELAMIVDLMRNDLGRVANAGSVKVLNSSRIETYQNVFHQVATVEAKVSDKTSFAEIMRATFPAGSITGCPKIRAMQIISEIEGEARSYYCGSIGYLDFNGNFDLNVAIRTLIKEREDLSFGLGSGIVFDSNPQSEFEETLAKGETLFELLQ